MGILLYLMIRFVDLKRAAACEKQCIMHSSMGSTRLLPADQCSRTYGTKAFSNMEGWLKSSCYMNTQQGRAQDFFAGTA